MSMPGASFSAGEQILCYHGPLIYEAKILKAEHLESGDGHGIGPHYLVHYKGWNEKWDEWVPESRVMKFTPENIEKQKSLSQILTKIKSEKEAANQAQSSSKSGSSSTSSSKKQSSGAKRRDSVGTERHRRAEELKRQLEAKMAIPEDLKAVLVDDWEMITKHQKLLQVPSPITIDAFLQAYEKQAPSHLGGEQVISEVIAGLKDYFELSIGTLLLYSFERPQFKSIRMRTENASMTSIFGPIHLLRLFVKMPSLLAQVPISEKSLTILKDHFNAMLTFMSSKAETFFPRDGSLYESAPPEYISLVKTA